MITSETQFKLCQSHAVSLGRIEERIEAGFETVNARLDRANGKLERHDAELREMQRTLAETRAAADENARDHQQIDKWRETVTLAIDRLSTTEASVRSASKSRIIFIRDAVLVAGFVLSLWFGYSGHKAALAAFEQAMRAKQEQMR